VHQPVDSGQSFDTFYRSNYRRAVAVATALTGSTAIAEELAQEAFLTLHARWSERPLDDPVAYLRRIVANRAVSAWRRSQAERRAVERLGAGIPAALELAIGNPELWKAVRSLPRRQAQLVVLVYVDDLTIEQAAETLGIGIPTAKTHVQRARERLTVCAQGWRTQR
jgi:RNA polymerase sigma-70 factor (ECF subfamily)